MYWARSACVGVFKSGCAVLYRWQRGGRQLGPDDGVGYILYALWINGQNRFEQNLRHCKTGFFEPISELGRDSRACVKWRPIGGMG